MDDLYGWAIDHVLVISGGFLGSSLSIAARPDSIDKDNFKKVALVRLLLGGVMGFVLSPAVLQYSNLDASQDTEFLASVISGISGYGFLMFVTDKKTRRIFLKILLGRVK